MAELRRRTWRWFQVRIASLPPSSAWSHALYPADPTSGRRAAHTPSVVELDDPDAIDAFFSRQAG